MEKETKCSRCGEYFVAELFADEEICQQCLAEDGSEEITDDVEEDDEPDAEDTTPTA